MRYACKDMSEDPQLPGPVLSVLLLVFAAVFVYGATQVHAGYSYKLGYVGPFWTGVIRIVYLLLAALCGAGGALLLAHNLRRRRR